MSNPTAEEILESLQTGKGFRTEYVTYDRSIRELVKYGVHPILKEELTEDVPEYVKEHASKKFYIEEFLGEELYENYKGQEVEVVERWGGEGEGDSAGIVLKIGDFYFQADWSYVSWDGYYYDGTEFYQVVPKEVMVTKYVRA